MRYGLSRDLEQSGLSRRWSVCGVGSCKVNVAISCHPHCLTRRPLNVKHLAFGSWRDLRPRSLIDQGWHREAVVFCPLEGHVAFWLPRPSATRLCAPQDAPAASTAVPGAAGGDLRQSARVKWAVYALRCRPGRGASPRGRLKRGALRPSVYYALRSPLTGFCAMLSAFRLPAAASRFMSTAFRRLLYA